MAAVDTAGARLSGIANDDEVEEEAGEVIESAPPLKVGEERELGVFGVKKKLLASGIGFETPELGDEVTVHYVGTLIDRKIFDSTRDRDEPVTFKVGEAWVARGLDNCIITMRRGERALFTLPPEMGYGIEGRENVPPNSVVQFEVELISWITVVNVRKDGGIIKKILEKGERNQRPGDLDEVLVRYQVELIDGTIVAKTPDEGIEFYVKAGHLCPALQLAIVTMQLGEKAQLTVQPRYAFGEEGRDSNGEIDAVPPNSVLKIDLLLVSIKPVFDVLGNSKVFKKILREGEGAFVADDGATVTVSYVGKLQDGTIFEKKGADGEQPLIFVTDEEQVISGLDRGAATMKKGEQAVLTINHEYGFGNAEVQLDLAKIPRFSSLIYEVEMLDFVKEKMPWEMTSQEKIGAARRKKEEGNLLYKNGKYQRAAKKYDKAADCVEDGFFGGDKEKEVKAVRLACWLNGAVCSLKQKDFQGTISLSSKVLEIESQNVKALYRRAQAYIETGDLFSAEMDIKKALEADPQNREVKSLQRTLKQFQAESNKRDAKLYANMFVSVTKDSPVPPKKLKLSEAEDEQRATKQGDAAGTSSEHSNE